MSVTNEELDFRASLANLITNLLDWLKGSGIVPTRDPLEEVVLRNLEIKEERLQDILEDNPREANRALEDVNSAFVSLKRQIFG